MKFNKKIFCALLVLVIFLSVSSISAADNVSDVMASDNSGFDSGISTSPNEKLEVASTIVVTNETFNNYFTNGALNDNVSAGSTLDFQGTFTGEAYKVNITKPVNIISSTGDALFNEIGKKDSTGGCFHISAGGSGTNVTDLKFINSAFYVTGAENVAIDNINMMADMNGVGSGTGFMCVQAGSRYVTVKNSYFENRGTGSSIVVIGYSDYCTVDNNEVFINGSSGNAVYITTFVPARYSGSAPTGNIISNNWIHGEASGFCMALVVAGNNNSIENNEIDYNGASGIAGQSFSTPTNNTYTGNVLTGGCSFSAGVNSYVADNTVDGAMNVAKGSFVEDNEVKSLKITGADAVVVNNVIGTGGLTIDTSASNTTLTDNIILSTVNVKSNNNNIKRNTVQSNDQYAIDLSSSTGNEVSDNKLSSRDYSGDEAVNAGTDNSVHDNGIGNIVTKDNFFSFFDADGNYKLNLTDLIFKGEFDSLVDAITINKPLTIQGLDASLKNMAFALGADDIHLDNLEMELTKAPALTRASAILINGNNTVIENIFLSYSLNESSDAYGIFAENVDTLIITDNVFTFAGATNGTHVNNVVYVSDSSNVVFENNEVNAALVSCPVDWREIPPASGIWVKFPFSEGVVFNDCSNLTIANNDIKVEYSDVVGEYDTIYVVDVKGSSDVGIVNNTIDAMGHSYIYGLYVESDGLLVDNNNLVIKSDINYANGIEIEASHDAIISNNNITAIAPALAYPVYSGMNGGDLDVDYIGNVIDATADIVYGMELCGNIENVIGNEITVNGNQTTALAVSSKRANISDNFIYAFGLNLNNASTVEIFTPMTAGIHLINSTATIDSNTIISSSRGILGEGGVLDVVDNYIDVEDNGLDNSFAILADFASVHICGNNIAYEGNTNGSTKNMAVYLIDCAGAEVCDNSFDIVIPSCYVDWKEVPPGSGNWVADPISEGILIDSPEVCFKNNNVTLGYNGVVGEYDTIYAVHILSDKGVIDSNTINAEGHSYIYALEVTGGDLTVENNDIYAGSDEYYANGIDVEGPVSGVIKNNNVTAVAPGVTYAIYSSMSHGNITVDYLNNQISSYAYLAYGMELRGLKETVSGNSFSIAGGDGIGILSSSKDVTVTGNDFDIDANSTISSAFVGVSGNATITDNSVVTGGEYAVDVLNITALVKDNYLVADNLTGDAAVNYNPKTSTVYNNTPRKDEYSIVSDGLEKYYGNKKQLEFTLVDASGKGVENKTISIIINGKTYNRTTDANGTVAININLNSGNYTVTATYGNVSCNASVVILSTVEGKDITKIFKNATQYEAKFVDADGNVLKNTMVKFNINGVMYERETDANGIAKLNINLPQGEYIITAINPANNEMHANNITVLANIADNKDIVKYYKNGTQYSVKLLGSDGKAVGAGEKVTFNVNGIFYTRITDASGIATLTINLPPNDYVITADYNGCRVANNITVLPVLNATDLKMKYGDKSQFKANLVDGQGKPYAGQNIQFNINGVLYYRTTDSTGQAALNINLPSGEYIITSSFNGSNIANKITISG